MNSTSSAGRPALLFLSQTLPYPPDGGVHIRTFNVLRLLAREFDITALCFYRRTERVSLEAVEAGVNGLSHLAHCEAFPIPQEHSRLRLASDHAHSVAHCEAYTLRAYASRSFRARIVELLARGKVDLVHMDSLDLAWYLQLLSEVPVACTHHNVESRLLRRRALAERSPWRRMYMLRQAKWIEDLERRWCERVALNVAVSETDRSNSPVSRRGRGSG